jgi:hypothetical protein
MTGLKTIVLSMPIKQKKCSAWFKFKASRLA